MIAQGDEFESALPSEDHNEEQINIVQKKFLLFTLVIRFHHHGDHVQADQNHNEDVKELRGYKVENQTLTAVLQTSDMSMKHIQERKFNKNLKQVSFQRFIDEKDFFLPQVSVLVSVASWSQVSSWRCSTFSVPLS